MASIRLINQAKRQPLHTSHLPKMHSTHYPSRNLRNQHLSFETILRKTDFNFKPEERRCVKEIWKDDQTSEKVKGLSKQLSEQAKKVTAQRYYKMTRVIEN